MLVIATNMGWALQWRYWANGIRIRDVPIEHGFDDSGHVVIHGLKNTAGPFSLAGCDYGRLQPLYWHRTDYQLRLAAGGRS